jgi:hypothetical protein
VAAVLRLYCSSAGEEVLASEAQAIIRELRAALRALEAKMKEAQVHSALIAP